jgi:hypothetical protein
MCSICGKDYPGICWLGLTCDHCKCKGHPTAWCYDNPDSPFYKGSQCDTAAVFVGRVGDSKVVDLWC